MHNPSRPPAWLFVFGLLVPLGIGAGLTALMISEELPIFMSGAIVTAVLAPAMMFLGLAVDEEESPHYRLFVLQHVESALVFGGMFLIYYAVMVQRLHEVRSGVELFTAHHVVSVALLVAGILLLIWGVRTFVATGNKIWRLHRQKNLKEG